MGCQKDIVSTIVEKEADYLKRLKAGWDNDYLLRILKDQMRLPCGYVYKIGQCPADFIYLYFLLMCCNE